MKYITYVADFETSYKDGQTWVWSACYANVSTEQLHLKRDIESFMEFALKGENKRIYFHNLKFDGSFILSYLLKNKYKQVDNTSKSKEFSALVDDMGQFYSIEIKRGKYKTKFVDMAKLFIGSLRSLAVEYGLQTLKGDMDYAKIRYPETELDNDELDYIYNDVKIMIELIKIARQYNFNKMTIASNAMQNYKDIIGKEFKLRFDTIFPILPTSVFDYLQKGYRGGCSMINRKYEGKVVHVYEYDKKSMHPSQMIKKPLPWGTPTYFTGKYEYDSKRPLYVQKISCDFIRKKDKPPTIQIRGVSGFVSNEWVDQSNGIVELTLTNMDLELFLENYHVFHLKYIDGYKFLSSTKLFKPYIEYWYNIKETTTNKSERAMAKRMLNSLYGKFGAKRIKRNVIFGLDDYGVLKNMELKETESKTVYIPIAMFITSYSRHDLFTDMAKVWDDFVYCDTDSLHLLNKTNKLDLGNKIGQYAMEFSGTGKYLKQKTYFVELDKEFCYTDKMGNYINTKLTCAGLNQDYIKAHNYKITLDSFEFGATFPKLKSCQVQGGVALIETQHKITKPVYSEHVFDSIKDGE